MPNKKETQEQKVKRLIDDALERKSKKIITGCNFIGVQYDAKAVDTITTIAEGLVVNAKALGKLAEILKSSNVEIEAMLKVDG